MTPPPNNSGQHNPAPPQTGGTSHNTSHTPSQTSPKQMQFPCKQCGANLLFQPGSNSLVCPYCGAANEVKPSGGTVQALDFETYVHSLPDDDDHVQDSITVKCVRCAAETTLAPNVTASVCPFCGTGIVATASSQKTIRPNALLPFGVNQKQSSELFRTWVNSLYFAPVRLKKDAESASIKGVYIPAWTYDTDTYSQYTGQRGDDYWETETYTDTDSNGNSVTRTRQVLKTRWWPVSGDLQKHFDDILVLATQTLPKKQVGELEPWDLENLVAYADEYLSGFVSESYQIGLPQGFDTAKGIMDPPIRHDICQQIGGDHQQISSLQTQYDATTFKHILLPMWISAYQFNNKTFRFLVNGRTGEVQGERPYSFWKIFSLIMGILLVIAAIFFISQSRSSRNHNITPQIPAPPTQQWNQPQSE